MKAPVDLPIRFRPVAVCLFEVNFLDIYLTNAMIYKNTDDIQQLRITT